MAKPAREIVPALPSRKVLQEAAVIALLALICCMFFWKAVTLRGVFFYYDHALQNYPYRLFFAQGLSQGQLSLWTPDIFCGFPLFAESQGNALYPPFLLLFGLLPPWVAYNCYTVLHFFLAALFAYVLARVMGLSRTGGFVAGTCYMLAGPLLYHVHHTNILVGICWLPLLLALTELVFRRRSVVPLLALAAAAACLVLGAQPQYTLYTVLICGIYVVWRMRLIEIGGSSARTTAALLAAFGLAAVVTVMLVAVQLLPLAELVTHTSRAGGASPMPGISPGVPGNLLTLMLPHYSGSPGMGSYWGSADVGLYSELTLFVGTASLLLALTGALTDKSRRALFFVALGLFAFIFSMGFTGSLYNLFAFLPVFRATRLPSRFAFVTALCVAMLAGMGLDRLRAASNRRQVRRAAVVSAAVVLVLSALCLAIVAAGQSGLMGLSRQQLADVLPMPRFELEVVWTHLHKTLPADVWRLVLVVTAGTALLLISARRAVPARATAVLWCALVLAELAYVGREFNAVTDASVYCQPPALAQTLKDLPHGRIYRSRYYDPTWASVDFADYPSTLGWVARSDQYAACLDRIPHNANMIWGIPSVNGFSPLQTMRLKTLLGKPYNRNTLIEFDLSPALNLLGARYILSPREDLPDQFQHITKVGDINIFENPDALPRAFVVHRTVLIPDPDISVTVLTSPDFDYRRRVIVHDASALLPADEPEDSGQGSAEIVRDAGDTITVHATLKRPGYLVLADQHYPGWRVEVDGRKAELLRVNYMLKGVRLDAGEHDVRFVFRPVSFRIGLAVTLCGLALLAGGTVLALTGRRRLPAAGEREREPLLDRPYSRRTVRLVCFSAAVFLALGPLVYMRIWRRGSVQITPRSYAVSTVFVKTYYLAADERLAEAYAMLRDLTKWWPDNARLRRKTVSAGFDYAMKLLEEGRPEEAREVATELCALLPEEVRIMAPAISRLSRWTPRSPDGAP